MRTGTPGGLLALALLGLAGCAAFEVEDPAEADEDQATATSQLSVKTALLRAEDLDAAPIRVEYVEGVVYLKGFVETEPERQRALEVAREALPEVEFVNELRVWGTADESLQNAERPRTGVAEETDS